MKQVGFSQMKHGTREDYLLLAELEGDYVARTADRVLRELASHAEDTFEGYKISRLRHATQSATRAWRDGAGLDWVVSALLHDIGDGLAPRNHDRFSAEILRPFVRDECAWVVEHHGIFQTLYYGHHYGWDPNARDRFRGHPCFDTCSEFCERWDQASFDPDYDDLPLSFFEDQVREVFGRAPYDPVVIQEGVVLGLPAVASASL